MKKHILSVALIILTGGILYLSYWLCPQRPIAEWHDSNYRIIKQVDFPITKNKDRGLMYEEVEIYGKLEKRWLGYYRIKF